MGYERALEPFAGVASQSAQTVVDRLVTVGEEWASGSIPDDDITFVVLSIRQEAAREEGSLLPGSARSKRREADTTRR